MIDRALTTVIAAAAAGAAAVLVVFAAGFAIYAVLEPAIGVAGAAGAVALIAAIGLGVFAFLMQQRARKREEEAARAQAQLAEELPFNLGTFARDRPIITLALTAVTGLAASRNPGLVRELMALVTRFRGS